jgi:hypothetical protein
MTEAITRSNNIDFTVSGSGTTNSKITGTSSTISIEGLSGGLAVLSGLSDPRSIASSVNSVDDVTNKITIDKKTWKDSVKGATTVLGTFSTSFSNGQQIDGNSVTLVTGDRILIKDQGSSENGIYTVNSSGAPTRTSDAQSGIDSSGSGVIVLQGTTNGSTYWFCDTVSSSFGSSITFDQISEESTPVGSNTEFQYNNSGVFGATTDLTITTGTPNTLRISEGSTTTDTNIATDSSHTGVVKIMTGSSATGKFDMGSSTSIVQLRGSDVSTGMVFEKTSSQSISNTSWTKITFTTAKWSNGNISESNDIIVVGEAGVYRISYLFGADSGNTTTTKGRVQINGNGSDDYLKTCDVPGGHADGRGGCTSTGYLYLNANDQVKFQVYLSPARSICGSSKIGQFSVIKLLGT